MTKPYLQRTLLLLCSIVCIHVSYAQKLGGTGTDAKMSPNGGADGTSLGSIHSPNLYDGSTNVQVPIYSYEGPGGGSYGVSFSYNTKGIKSDQIASNVGLGFVLNSGGGSIQRVVKDLPDELDTSAYAELQDYYGGYVDYNKMRGRLAVSLESPTEAARTDVYRDKESDDFMVSLGSLSFTFNIGKTGLVFTHPNRRVKVEILNQGNPIGTQVPWPPYMEFRLTDEQGIVYYFKKGDMNNPFLRSSYPQGQVQDIFRHPVIERWVVSSITFPNGSAINYTYNDISMNQYAKNANHVATEAANGGVSIGIPESQPINFATPATVQYPNGTTVSFEYDSQTSRCDLYNVPPLSKIRISSGGNCTVYKLEQAYFVAYVPGYSTTELAYGAACNSIGYTPPPGENFIESDRLYRLKLKAIRLWNCAETESEPFYSFEYDATQLGVRGSSQDWFGYYNGKSAQWSGGQLASPSSFSIYSSIPMHQTIGYNGGAVSYGLDKSTDINYMKAGILSKVKNAYGGEVQFNYGAHSGLTNPITGAVTLPTDANFMGADANDGLRLESIVEREKMRPNDYVTTTFTYEQGQRFLTGGYFRSWDKMTGATGTTNNREVWQTNYVSPHHLVNGSNHGYGKVTTTVRNQSNDLLSRRETIFTNLTDATTSTPRYTILGGTANYFDFPFTDKQYLRDWEMGLPLSISEYDQNNRIVSKVINEYDFISALDLTSSQTIQVLNERSAKIAYDGAPVVASGWGGYNQTFFALRSFSDTYRPYTGAALLQRSTVYRYLSDNSYTTDETHYTYDSRNNLVDIKNQASDGSILSTRTIYNYAVSPAGGTTIYNMTQAGLEKIVGTERWKQAGLAANGSTDKLLDASISTYTFQNGKLNLNGQHLLAIAQPITGSFPTAQNINNAFAGNIPANFRKTAAVVLADAKGNPLESTIPGTESYKAMIWDTLSGQKLAEAVNAHYADIAYSSFETRSGGCNFTYTQAALGSIVAGGMSGKNAYELWNSTTNAPNVLSGTQSLGGQEYLLTFWVKGTGFLPKIGNTALPVPADPIAVVGNWKQYQIRFTGAGAVSIAGTAPGTLIDEVRLHPVSAMMQSQTYELLFGISSATDARGRITYFEYDGFGRQRLVRDQEGNILSKTEQKIQ
jgi:YD repeat-containing protein